MILLRSIATETAWPQSIASVLRLFTSTFLHGSARTRPRHEISAKDCTFTRGQRMPCSRSFWPTDFFAVQPAARSTSAVWLRNFLSPDHPATQETTTPASPISQECTIFSRCSARVNRPTGQEKRVKPTGTQPCGRQRLRRPLPPPWIAAAAFWHQR